MKSGYHDVARFTFSAMVHGEKAPKGKTRKVSSKEAEIANIRRRREAIEDELKLKRDINDCWEA